MKAFVHPVDMGSVMCIDKVFERDCTGKIPPVIPFCSVPLDKILNHQERRSTVNELSETINSVCPTDFVMKSDTFLEVDCACMPI